MARNLIFIHVPKTAGTTCHNILRREYRFCQHYQIDGGAVRESLEAFMRLSDKERRAIRILRGHHHFGMHEYLYGDTTYITMLRNPVDRMISFYFYIKRLPSHYLYDRVAGGNMSLHDFVGSGITGELDNEQVRLLSGHDSDLPYGCISKDHLITAKSNVENYFSAVGLQERFDETLLLWRKTLHWLLPPYYQPQNVTHKRQKVAETPKAVIDTIREVNQFDIQLYEWAEARFEAQRVEHQIDAKMISRFLAGNKRYQVYSPYVDKFRQTLTRSQRE